MFGTVYSSRHAWSVVYGQSLTCDGFAQPEGMRSVQNLTLNVISRMYYLHALFFYSNIRVVKIEIELQCGEFFG